MTDPRRGFKEGVSLETPLPEGLLLFSQGPLQGFWRQSDLPTIWTAAVIVVGFAFHLLAPQCRYLSLQVSNGFVLLLESLGLENGLSFGLGQVILADLRNLMQ